MERATRRACGSRRAGPMPKRASCATSTRPPSSPGSRPTRGNKTAMGLAEHGSGPSSRSPSTPGVRPSRRRIPKRRGGLRPCRSTSGQVRPRLGSSTPELEQPFSMRKDGSTADKYVRLTVVLASILFLVGLDTLPVPGRPLRPDQPGHRPARAVAHPAVTAAATSFLRPCALALLLLLHGAGRSESLKSA